MIGDIKIGGANYSNKIVKRSPTYTKSTIGAMGYLIPNTKIVFTQLKKTFTKALIFHHFDPECHIQIEIEVFGYTIGGFISQLTLDNLG